MRTSFHVAYVDATNTAKCQAAKSYWSLIQILIALRITQCRVLAIQPVFDAVWSSK